MAGWLSRWMGGEAKVKTPQVPAPAPSSPPPAAPSTLPSPDAPTAAHRFGARRPLVGSQGEMAGFEFRLARNLERRLQSRPDPSARAAYAVALLSSMRNTVESGRAALATVAAEVLIRPQVLEQVPVGIHLVVQPWAAPEQEPELLACITSLRSRGVRVGRVAPQPVQTQALDFVLLPMVAEQAAEFWLSLAQWRSSQPNLPLMVSDVDNIDDLERALRSGASFATGRLDRVEAPPESTERPMQTGAQKLCQLLNDVVMDRDTALVAQEIRADVTLSYKLLRYVNSPAVGLTRGVESIDQALLVLGRNELYRWLSVLLMAGADGRSTSRALQEVALSRARLLESLAQNQSDPATHPPAALFTVGVLSLLDVILQMPLAQALEPLRLSEQARQALLERTGPWAPYLALASDLERHDMAAATEHAMAFGGVAQVLELSDAAWKWAAEVSQAARGG